MPDKTIFICVQVKNTKKYLRNLFDEINKLDYPKRLISLSILENDSVDGSYDYIISSILPSLKGYKKVIFEKKDIGFHLLHEQRHIPEIQAERCKALKTLRQHVMSHHYGYEDYYWIVDSDFVKIPKDFINIALSHDKDIMMAPTYLPNGVLYDLTSAQKGVTLKELAEANPNESILELSQVDGAFFCKKEVVEAGCNYFEADKVTPDGVAFSQSAKAKGFKMYGLMDLKLIHADTGEMVGDCKPSVNYLYTDTDMPLEFHYETITTSHEEPVLYLLNECNEPVLHVSSRGNYHIGIHMSTTNNWKEISLPYLRSFSSDAIKIDSHGIHINGIDTLKNHLDIFKDALQRSVKVRYLKVVKSIQEDFSESPIENLIGAFYYGWYTGDNWKKSCARYKKYDGSPQLDWYRSLDEHVIETHIDQARKAGIDFFIISFDGSEYTKYFLSMMAAISKEKDFKICIHCELTNVFGDPVDVNDEFYNFFRDNFRFLASFFNDKTWLKIDGKPALFLYASRAIQGALEEITLLRNMASEAGIPELYVFGDEIWWDKKQSAATRLCQLDAIYAYNMYIPGGICGNNYFTGKDYLSLTSGPYGEFLQLAKDTNTLVAPTIMPRYDDSAVRTIKDHYPIPADSGEFYKAYYYWAKQFFHGRQKVLLITSFNEWYEDTQIEPYVTKGKGDDYDKEPSYGDKFLILTKTFKEDMENN